MEWIEQFYAYTHLWYAVAMQRSSSGLIVGCECDEATSNSFSLSAFLSVICGESEMCD